MAELREIRDFEQLIVYLRDELDWPIDSDNIEDITYEYTAGELGINEKDAAKIEDIKQLMPLDSDQPWGIFFVEFEKKTLSVVVLRRILGQLVVKKRSSLDKSEQRVWNASDLLFISRCGNDDEQGMTFAHFSEPDGSQLPVLRVLGWDEKDTKLHIDDADAKLRSSLCWPENQEDIVLWRKRWSSIFTLKPRQVIKTSMALAKTLAELAKDTKDKALEILKLETENGPFRKTMAQFKAALIHDLNEDDFADMYAQTIAYGLLYTAIRNHSQGGSGEVSPERLQQLILPANSFLKEVMESFFNIGGRKYSPVEGRLTGIDFDELGVNEIIDTLRDEKTDFGAILRDFGNKNPNEDPVIHFYELFLGEYDAIKRKSRGVYYTPQPVVSFIVRSVHEALKREFGLERGLADISKWADVMKKNPSVKLPKGVEREDFFVQILDPATGTGTFLVQTIDVICNEMKGYWKSQGKNDIEIAGLWGRYVPDCLLPRLYGFEIMMAPYSIAHLKIGIKLFETGYRGFETDKERVRVYLTNTLEEPVDVTKFLHQCDPAMAQEAKEANEVKLLNSITVVIGNPPYSGHSLNNSDWIRNLLRTRLADGADSYFRVDEADLGERNPKWLNDDYVKFIRYAQSKLANSGVGVFGFITNHGYLDNPTFRGMRQSLMTTYGHINLIDLHGNSKKKEKCEDGSKDENVFNIMQGVAVNISVKLGSEKHIKHCDVLGTREGKNSFCAANTCFNVTNTNNLEPTSNLYIFCPQNVDVREEYEYYYKVNDVFPINGVGITTARDNFVINHEKETVIANAISFKNSNLANSELCNQLNIPEKKGWNITRARKLIQNESNLENFIKPILYRPFEKMIIFYHDSLIWRTVKQIMHHMLAGENLGLISVRQVAEGIFNHVFITRNIVESRITVSNKGIGFIFPLYLYPPKKELSQSTNSKWNRGKGGRLPNLDEKFVESLAAGLELEFVSDGRGDLERTFGPEDVFYYIYGAFHSPEYRSRYAEFLKMDFPRVPLTGNLEVFSGLCGLGAELAGLHLMESAKIDEHITELCGAGDNGVTKVGEKGKKLADAADGIGKLYINNTQYFDGMREDVWNFHIGGYQVCYKWLADRKGKTLSGEDIRHYKRIVAVITQTIAIMSRIDELIEDCGGWPIS